MSRVTRKLSCPVPYRFRVWCSAESGDAGATEYGVAGGSCWRAAFEEECVPFPPRLRVREIKRSRSPFPPTTHTRNQTNRTGPVTAASGRLPANAAKLGTVTTRLIYTHNLAPSGPVAQVHDEDTHARPSFLVVLAGTTSPAPPGLAYRAPRGTFARRANPPASPSSARMGRARNLPPALPRPASSWRVISEGSGGCRAPPVTSKRSMARYLSHFSSCVIGPFDSVFLRYLVFLASCCCFVTTLLHFFLLHAHVVSRLVLSGRLRPVPGRDVPAPPRAVDLPRMRSWDLFPRGLGVLCFLLPGDSRRRLRRLKLQALPPRGPSPTPRAPLAPRVRVVPWQVP